MCNVLGPDWRDRSCWRKRPPWTSWPTRRAGSSRFSRQGGNKGIIQWINDCCVCMNMKCTDELHFVPSEKRKPTKVQNVQTDLRQFEKNSQKQSDTNTPADPGWGSCRELLGSLIFGSPPNTHKHTTRTPNWQDHPVSLSQQDPVSARAFVSSAFLSSFSVFPRQTV